MPAQTRVAPIALKYSVNFLFSIIFSSIFGGWAWKKNWISFWQNLEKEWALNLLNFLKNSKWLQKSWKIWLYSSGTLTKLIEVIYTVKCTLTCSAEDVCFCSNSIAHYIMCNPLMIKFIFSLFPQTLLPIQLPDPVKGLMIFWEYVTDLHSWLCKFLVIYSSPRDVIFCAIPY